MTESATPPANETRRKDRLTSSSVDIAIAFQATLGDKVAHAYMIEKNVPTPVIDRVLERRARRGE
ncbi:MAG: hypothetical protein M3N23_06055 [Pseudomonadota bacterium]|nr:hypothetical protein [Pseudomonadota bacterium]